MDTWRAISYLLDRTYPWLLGLIAGGAIFFLSWAPRAFASSDRQAAIFSALLAISGLLAAILLALMGLLVSLDGREVVAEMRRGPWYGRLVSMATEGILVFVLLAFVSLGCLFIDGSTDPYVVQTGFCVAALFLVTNGLVQVLRFAFHVSRVMRHPGDDQPDNPENSPEAARRRLGHDERDEGFRRSALPSGRQAECLEPLH